VSAARPTVGLAAALVLALGAGCADRGPEPPPPAPAGTVAAPPASPPMTPPPGASRRLPAPVAMPGGGVRIDMRGSTGHVRALVRQPDGTYKSTCIDAPEIAQPRTPR
jgi:hypothetical protein